MPQQLLLEISNASARSKGQARRRTQPAVSKDDRKAQRNLTRRERAKCKKGGKAQQECPSLSRIDPSVKPTSAPVFTAEQWQSYTETLGNASATTTLSIHDATPRGKRLPAKANGVTLGALAQASRHIAAHSKVQHANDAVREDEQRAENVGVIKASDGTKVSMAPQEQDLNAAGILVEVARKQHPIPLGLATPITQVLNTGNMSLKKCGASEANASMGYSRKCPVSTCAYHVDVGPWLKTERSKHIITHFEGEIKFGTEEIGYSLPWPNFIEDPEQFFRKIEVLKRHVRKYYTWSSGDSRVFECWNCFHKFDSSSFVEHLDDCVVNAVYIQASQMAQACPVPSYDHDPIDFPSKSHMNRHMIKSYWPSLGCGRCYTDQCQCPPMQLAKNRSISQP